MRGFPPRPWGELSRRGEDPRSRQSLRHEGPGSVPKTRFPGLTAEPGPALPSRTSIQLRPSTPMPTFAVAQGSVRRRLPWETGGLPRRWVKLPCGARRGSTLSRPIRGPGRRTERLCPPSQWSTSGLERGMRLFRGKEGCALLVQRAQRQRVRSARGSRVSGRRSHLCVPASGPAAVSLERLPAREGPARPRRGLRQVLRLHCSGQLP